MNDVVQHIDQTLDALIARPGFFGYLAAVELQMLRLLEVRAVATGATSRVDLVNESWQLYLASEFPGSAPVSLHMRIHGSAADMKEHDVKVIFSAKMREFVVRERATQAELVPASPYHWRWSNGEEHLSDLFESREQAIADARVTLLFPHDIFPQDFDLLRVENATVSNADK